MIEEEVAYKLIKLYYTNKSNFNTYNFDMIKLSKIYKELCREIKSGAFSMQVADCERNIRIQFEKLQQENKQLKEVIDRAIEELKKGLHELDTRRREDVYVEEYLEESIDILEEASR